MPPLQSCNGVRRRVDPEAPLSGAGGPDHSLRLQGPGRRGRRVPSGAGEEALGLGHTLSTWNPAGSPGRGRPPAGLAAGSPWSGASSLRQGLGGAGVCGATRGAGPQPQGDPLRTAPPETGITPSGKGFVCFPQKGKGGVWSVMGVRLRVACPCLCPQVASWETRRAGPSQRVSNLLPGSTQLSCLLGTMDPTSPASHTAECMPWALTGGEPQVRLRPHSQGPPLSPGRAHGNPCLLWAEGHCPHPPG